MDRNKKSISAVRSDFEATQKEMGSRSKVPLPVFCVASRVYLTYQTRPDAKMLGFPNECDTQIPALRDWMVKFTFQGRKDAAEAVISATEALITDLKPWVEDRRGDRKLSAAEKTQIKLLFSRELEELEQVQNSINCLYGSFLFITFLTFLSQKLTKLSRDVSASCLMMIDEKIYSNFRQIERSAAIESRRSIGKLGQGSRWNTYRAINLRRGDFANSKRGAVYKWNDQLLVATRLFMIAAN